MHPEEVSVEFTRARIYGFHSQVHIPCSLAVLYNAVLVASQGSNTLATLKFHLCDRTSVPWAVAGGEGPVTN